MEYGIRELSELAGVSARTLRYYDEIDLLKPLYVNEAGYRFYGDRELELLQQILFYRERGFDLKRIRKIIYEDDFYIVTALREHLLELENQRKHMDALIWTVRQTILSMRGECEMSDKEKFAAFKENVIKENEESYGAEVRKKYGLDALDGANQKIRNMSEADWRRFKSLENEIHSRLTEGVRSGMLPESDAAREIVIMHRQWLEMTWKQYSPQAHKGMAQTYVADSRFREYYDSEAAGCAELLKAAIFFWADKAGR